MVTFEKNGQRCLSVFWSSFLLLKMSYLHGIRLGRAHLGNAKHQFLHRAAKSFKPLRAFVLTLCVTVWWKIFTGNSENCDHMTHVMRNGLVCPYR